MKLSDQGEIDILETEHLEGVCISILQVSVKDFEFLQSYQMGEREIFSDAIQEKNMFIILINQLFIFF